MQIILDSQEQKSFFNKFQNLPKSFKIKRWGNKRTSTFNRINQIRFAGKEVEENKIVDYFLVLENRYRFALCCLEEIQKDCETVTSDKSKRKELKRKAKSNSIQPEFIIKVEYFIFAINSCLDNIAHVINIVNNLGINETRISFEAMYNKIKRKRDKFSVYIMKERINWIKEFRDIRNRMTHHQIINFTSKLSEQIKTNKVTYTKHCISVINEKDNEIQKPLPRYFDDIVKNYEKFRNQFYKKLNNIL